MSSAEHRQLMRDVATRFGERARPARNWSRYFKNIDDEAERLSLEYDLDPFLIDLLCAELLQIEREALTQAYRE